MDLLTKGDTVKYETGPGVLTDSDGGLCEVSVVGMAIVAPVPPFSQFFYFPPIFISSKYLSVTGSSADSQLAWTEDYRA